jgi:basic membrane protein A
MSRTSSILRHLTDRSAITRMQAIMIAVIVVIAAASAAVYYFMAAPTGCPSGSKCIAVVSDVGGRGDLAFNDMAFKGGAKAATDFGLKMVELISKSEADYVPNLETAAKDPGVILVVGVGFLLGDALKDVGSRYPDQNFIGIDTFFTPSLPNVINISYEEHKGSAIVGAIAALVAANYGYPHIGVVLGIEIPVLWKFEIGYKWGADWALKWYQNKFGKAAPVIGDTPVKERVLWTYTGTFSDVTKGYEAAKAMYAQDAVAVYNVAGPLGLGINQAVQEIATAKGLTMGPPFWIGVDADQDWINPGFVLTSCLKRVDTGVYLAAQLVVQGKFREVASASGGYLTLGIGTNVAGTPVEGIQASTLANLDEYIQMGVDAEQMSKQCYFFVICVGGKTVLPMPADQIKSKVSAMRDALPSWIWDAATELQSAIQNDPNLVPMAMSQEVVDQWRATLG